MIYKINLIKKILITSLLLVGFTSLKADNIRFRTLNMNDGLSHTDVTCITQDVNGLIWIGTTGGVQSFDGYALQDYSYYEDYQRVRKSHERITSLSADSTNLWVGTESGLLRFNFNNGRFDELNFSSQVESLSHTMVKKVFAASDKTIWTFTSDSAYSLKYDSERKLLLPNDISALGGSLNRNLHSVYEYKGYIWLCTNDSLFQTCIDDTKLKVLNSYSCKTLSRCNELSSSFYIKNNFLYLRVASGCVRYPIDDNGIINLSRCNYYNFNKLNPDIPVHSYGKIIVDNNNSIWCSSSIGLLHISESSGNIYTNIYSRKSSINSSISSNFISYLFVDSFDNLWVGTWGRGLNYASLSIPLFGSIFDNPSSNYSIKGTFVRSIEREDDGTLWILTQKQGLNKYRIDKGLLQSRNFSDILGKGTIFKSLRFNKTKDILYIGLINGLVSYNINSEKLKFIVYNNKEALVPENIEVSRIEYDNNGNLWVATWKNGIYCFKDYSGQLSFVRHITENDGLNSNCIPFLYYDSEKNEMFACTKSGINRLILKDEGLDILKNVSYSIDENKKNSLSNNFISSIDKQNDSIYWVGTLGGGLNKICIKGDRDNDYSAESYMVQDGLMSNDAEIVIVDDADNVWIGGYGIVKYDSKTGIFSRYDFLDGVQGDIFKFGASYKGRDGVIYMGGVNGLTYFYPNHVQTGDENYRLYLSNLYIHGNKIKVGDEMNGVVALPTILDKTKELVLHHDQNDFAIEFSALGYKLSNRLSYRYRLNGYDNEWRQVSVHDNKVLYSNLDYSTYEFELQYSINNGQTWNEDSKNLRIVILPPWWLTPFAKITYLVLIFSTIILILYLYVQELNMKHKISLHDIEKQKEEENHQLKLQFFMNISHEFKTPLTLILSSIERIEDEFKCLDSKLSSKVVGSFDSISRNANRLLVMITELVDFRKSDLNISDLNLKWEFINNYINQIVDEFVPWANRKNITLNTNIEDSVLMTFDPEKFSMIFINLLSNAVKYTPNGGRIDISLMKCKDPKIKPLYKDSYQVGETVWGEDVCVIKVSDTGVGISSESINKIYDRFFQVRDKSTSHLGSGIGLAIAKNMVLLHNGNIVVSSERMKGTEFIVTLPVGKDVGISDTTQFDIDNYLHNAHIEYNYSFDESSLIVDKPVVEENETSDKHTILIVEDNIELLSMLEGHFSEKYNVIKASNGSEGLKACSEFYPDLIISDVMMPVMDGIEMCKAIRNNLSIAYTPIIMLTAKSSVENQIEGYESGADLYIPKPFSLKLLELNVSRLIEHKLKMMKSVEDNNGIPQTESQVGNSEEEKQNTENVNIVLENKETEITRQVIKSEKDKEFIKNLSDFLEHNISNPDLSVDLICKEMGIGRTRLYSSVREISGQSLGDFIRDMRLNKAAHLLRYSDMNITEIIYETGFGSNSHFSKVFKNKFGVTPTDYAKQ